MDRLDWTTIAAVLLTLTYFWQFCVLKKRKNNLPPSPRGLPIIGHLHMLGKNPHQDLYKLAKEHGPIMCLRFGFVPNIIVSSPHAAEQFLKTHDLIFASRPPHDAAKYIAWDQKNLSFGQYGPFWRSMRKLCTLELLSNCKINSFQPMRREELELFVESLKKAAKDHAAVDLSVAVAFLTTGMSCRMVFGKKYVDEEIDERGFKAVIQETMQLSAAPNLGDYFPYLGVLDLQGLTRRMKAIGKVFDNFFEKIIEEHVQRGQHTDTKDFVDTMMRIMESGEVDFKFDRGHIKAIMLDMLVGSMDTSATAVEWILAELLKHPRVMKKLQVELEQAVGLDRLVEESDLDKLDYLDMVVKENFRLHPVAPLLLPHEAMEDCTVDGFHIPKKSRVIINIYSIGRDPNAWTDPDKFFPERFLGSNIDVRGRDFQLIPFGSGRRSCPGMQLGLTMVKLVVAQLVHCFDWELPSDMPADELDMTEEFGIVVTRAKHLTAVPTYRLHV
uniref:Cytochrome P450 n=1 Tax=Nothapodytes nimmoniana TaxID=159386 RepID=A0A7L7RB57_NOTNI|nr:cytochrome P450 [Nothapodytes nimmoniana]